MARALESSDLHSRLGLSFLGRMILSKSLSISVYFLVCEIRVAGSATWLLGLVKRRLGLLRFWVRGLISRPEPSQSCSSHVS